MNNTLVEKEAQKSVLAGGSEKMTIFTSPILQIIP
jgi:hypothetical protein